MQINELSPSALAYLGDSVIELKVRTYLVKSGVADAGKLNKMALDFVKAGAQSDAFDHIEGVLSEEELSWFKRGRNNHTMHIPKSANAAQYRKATGMEVLFGWLFMCENHARIDELFNIAYELK